MTPWRISLLPGATCSRRSFLPMGSWQVIITIQLQLLALLLGTKQWCRLRAGGHALQTWKGKPGLAKCCGWGMWALQPLPIGIQSGSVQASILPKFLEKLAHISFPMTPSLERLGKAGWLVIRRLTNVAKTLICDIYWFPPECSHQVTGLGRWVHHLLIDGSSGSEITVKHSKKNKEVMMCFVN